jgi:predicted transcriptional regulator
LARRLSANVNTVRYHAQVLIRSGVLAKDGARLRLVGDKPLPSIEDRILAVVARAPGIHLTGLARALDVSRSCAEAHVTTLLLSRRLESRAVSGARRFFLPAASASEPRGFAATLGADLSPSAALPLRRIAARADRQDDGFAARPNGFQGRP